MMVPSNPKEGWSQEARAECGCHSLGMESLVVCDGARLRREAFVGLPLWEAGSLHRGAFHLELPEVWGLGI